MKTSASLLVCVLLVTNAAQAEVLDAREGAFSVQTSAVTAATPAQVYAALGKPGLWWDPAHTWSGSAKNLSLQLRAGGCFCEKLPPGGSVEHGRVVFAQPGKLLRLDAALGPLQQMAVTAVLSFELKPEAAGTRVTMTYRVSGALTLEAAKLAPGVDQVMGTQFGRLIRFLE
jgi:uncharacterized protein YndB with AHSA1/START domain